MESRHGSTPEKPRIGEPVPHWLSAGRAPLTRQSFRGLRSREAPLVDYQKAFDDFDAAGGRRALERQLAELDRAAQAAVQEGGEPDPRLMALREGLQQLLAAINDLAKSGERTDPRAGDGDSPP